MKTTGGVKTLKIHITEPLAMDTDIEMRNLSLFVGANGTGKSFILINTWAITSIAQILVLGADATTVQSGAQFFYDHSFSDQNINGSIEAEFEHGPILALQFDKGKVVSVNYSNFEGIDTPTKAVYMSTQFRTFDAISGYLKIRKLIHRGDQEEFMKEALTMYKLYDVMHIEGLISRMPFVFDPKDAAMFENYNIEDEIKGISVDLDKCDFYLVTPKGNKYMCSYGNGHQSIINMFLTKLLG